MTNYATVMFNVHKNITITGPGECFEKPAVKQRYNHQLNCKRLTTSYDVLLPKLPLFSLPQKVPQTQHGKVEWAIT